MTNIQTGVDYSLGGKAYWLLVLQRSGAAIMFLALSFVLLLADRELKAGVISAGIISNIALFIPVAINVALLLAFIALVIAFLVAWLEYGTSKIMLSDTGLKITRGILSKEEVQLPYRRIQSVEIKQTLFYRLLGVGHLVISTTTDLNQPNSGAETEMDDEVVPIMDLDLAQAVADELTKRAEVERMQVQNDI